MACGAHFTCLSENRKRNLIEVSNLRRLSQHFDIGAHTFNHIPITSVHYNQLWDELYIGKIKLENIIGKPVYSLAWPYGIYNKRAIEVASKVGFTQGRTTKELCISAGKRPFCIPTTLSAFPHYPHTRIKNALMNHNLSGLVRFIRIGCTKCWAELALGFFELALKNGGVWHLWGHSWEVEEKSMWKELALVFAQVSACKEVVHLSNTEMIRYI